MRKIASLLAVTFALASGSALALNETKETKENAQLAPSGSAAAIVNPASLATDPTMTSNNVDPTVKKKKKKTIAKNETTAKSALKPKTVETPGQTKGEESGGAAGSSGSSGSAGNG